LGDYTEENSIFGKLCSDNFSTWSECVCQDATKYCILYIEFLSKLLIKWYYELFPIRFISND
jgi:hypothetical protein